MRVRSILFCETLLDLENEDPSKIVKAVVNPSFAYYPKYVPTLMSFSVLVIVDELTEDSLNLRFTLQNEHDEKVLFQTDGRMEVGQAFVGTKRNVNIHIVLNNVEIESPGNYVFKISDGAGLIASEYVYIAPSKDIE